MTCTESSCSMESPASSPFYIAHTFASPGCESVAGRDELDPLELKSTALFSMKMRAITSPSADESECRRSCFSQHLHHELAGWVITVSPPCWSAKAKPVIAGPLQ